MNHAAASRGLWAERYVLDDLNEQERQEFEEHLFSCPKCAEEVREAAYFAANARAVLSGDDAPKAPSADKPGKGRKKPTIRARHDSGK